MTITHFSSLSLVSQLELLYNEGVHLAKRKSNNNLVILYQFGKWYVEIFYEKYRREVSHTRCTDDTDILDPYLEEIDISAILKLY